MASKKQAETPFNFEQSIAELETVVNQMEGEQLSLDQALKHFERGVTLTRQCQNALEQAEQTVQQLSADDKLEQFEPQE